MEKSFSDIFKPGAYPQKTYISRNSNGTRYTYEERLKQSLLIRRIFNIYSRTLKNRKNRIM